MLSNPLERAGYMLSMKGITVLDEDQTDAMAGLSDHAQSYYQRLMVSTISTYSLDMICHILASYLHISNVI